MAREIGLNVALPKRECSDRNCPYHGRLAVRRKTIEGNVASDKMKNTIIVQSDYVHFITKYLRYERRRSRIPAHNPPCIAAKVGDPVKIAQCRPISKTVSHVVVERLSGAKD